MITRFGLGTTGILPIGAKANMQASASDIRLVQDFVARHAVRASRRRPRLGLDPAFLDAVAGEADALDRDGRRHFAAAALVGVGAGQVLREFAA
jgi:hypothetical protein